nr:ribonuclease H-like domain-containing protein [Tanacetum cinerariifolium]
MEKIRHGLEKPLVVCSIYTSGNGVHSFVPPGSYITRQQQQPSAFSTVPLEDPTWNMNMGDGKTIPVTNTGHNILPTLSRPLYLHNVLVTPNIIKNLIYVRQFTRDDKCTIEFDEFGFSVKDFLTRHILLRCDSSRDLYPITKPSHVPSALLYVSYATWHQRIGHLGAEVLQSLISRNFISCNKEKSLHICHACQLGKHVKLSFDSLDTRVSSSFDLFILIFDFSNYTRPELLPMGTLSRHLVLRFNDLLAMLYVLVSLLVDTILLCLFITMEFDMTNLGALNYFLGISVTHDSTGMFLSQNKYALELLDMAHMANCNRTRTPVDMKSKLGSDEDPISDPTLNRSLAGGLHYLTVTRPDISYAVQHVCLHMHDP